MQRTGNKWVKKLPELQTTGDRDYELLIVQVIWLILGWESYIITQGYISLGQFAGKVNSKWVIQDIKRYTIICRFSLQ